MKILMKQDEINKVSHLWHLKRLFEDLFGDYKNYDLFCSISAYYSAYLLKVGTAEEQEWLEDFVKEYFVMRKQIVDARNASIDYLQSREYHESNMLNRKRALKQLNKEQKMCERINKFEEEFYERTTISLLRVENERGAREKEAEVKENKGLEQ